MRYSKKKWRSTAKVTIATVAVFATLATVATQSATADSTDEPSADETSAEILDAAPPVSEPDDLAEAPDGSLTATSDDGSTVEVSTEGTEPVAITNAEGETVGLNVPGAADGASVDGGVLFENTLPATDILVQPAADGGGVALINIQDSTAPSAFNFPVEVPAGGFVALIDDGGAAVFNAEGDTVVTIAKPWARDAAGNDVPTHFEVVDNKLIQHVDHSGVSAYPVVADPAWFIPVVWWVVRSWVANYAAKRVMESRGYRCDWWAPAWMCYKTVR